MLPGYADSAELIGKPILDLIAPSQHEQILENVRLRARGQTAPGVYETRGLRKDGSEFEMDVHTSTYELNGEIYSIAILRDITERKQAEKALRESEERFSAAFRSSPIPIAIFRPSDGHIIDVNDVFVDLLGYTREEIIGHTTTELNLYADPEDRKRIGRILAERGSLENFEFSLRKKSGDINIVLNSARLINLAGQDHYLSSLLDITERKRVEEALRKSETGLKEAQRLGRLGSWDWDATTDTITWSEEYYHIYGFDPSQRPPGYEEHLKAYTPESAARLDAAVKRNMQTGEPYVLDLELVRTDTPSRWITARSETKRDQNGQIVGLRGTAQDITERKRAEAEIHKLNQELEQRVADRTAQLEASNKELEAFAYSVSHDLRAPLRHIDGFLELLEEKTATTLNEQSQHYMVNISDAAKRMGMLIDDLLSFSRLGRHDMSKLRVDLGELIQEIIREFEPESHGRNIRWQIRNLPTVTGDRAMLRVVLVNLISNALKFTQPREQAEIEIGWLREEETETVIFVRDNGVGFDPRYVDKLFGVFQRLHRANEFEGTGIGLANVRRIINRHGGRTWAKGEVNQGATFYFAMPQTTEEGH